MYLRKHTTSQYLQCQYLLLCMCNMYSLTLNSAWSVSFIDDFDVHVSYPNDNVQYNTTIDITPNAVRTVSSTSQKTSQRVITTIDSLFICYVTRSTSLLCTSLYLLTTNLSPTQHIITQDITYIRTWFVIP
jgi:hypothetical protein